MPSPIQASIAAGQLQARQLEPQTNLQNPSDRTSGPDGSQRSDRGPAATFDLAPDAQRVTGGEPPAPASDGGDVQGAATDNTADRLAAGREFNAPQTDANAVTRELGALGVNNQSGPVGAPETEQQGPEVLGAFGPQGVGADNPAPNAASAEAGPSTAPGLDGVPEPGDLVRG